MKKINLFFALAFSGLFFLALPAQAQNTDSTGLPGDEFNLQGALELFKNATSPEAFEKALNNPDNHIHNLDLNGDQDADYIQVVNRKENDAHVFILQVAVSETETQDIAVIELEKTGEESASLQIIGDEEIFGEALIVEPGTEEAAFAAPLLSDDIKGPAIQTAGVIVNVWFWPCVRYVYAPGYRLWVSPWRWRHYPGWWRPWRPLSWNIWHPYRSYYHRNYIVVSTHRMVNAHRIYTPVHSRSVTVHNRYTVARNNYTVTRKRTTVTGPRGNSVTRKTTTVRGPQGHVRGSRTIVKKKKR